jgi:hypothetical protein
MVSGVSANVLPVRPRDGLHSTSEVAETLSIHPGTLGKRVSHLKIEQYGEWHPAVAQVSEVVIDRWWWNGAGRRAVLAEFGFSAAA